MSKNTTIIIIAVLIILGGVLYLNYGGSYSSVSTTNTPPTPAPLAPLPREANAPVVAPATVVPQQAGAAVIVSNFAFSPAVLTIPVGTAVTWKQMDSAPHTIVASGGTFASKSLSTGGVFTYTFTKAGTYDYHCSIHPSMTGKVVVQ